MVGEAESLDRRRRNGNCVLRCRAMTLQHFVEQYGYFAVFIGCFLEGETILVLAGFAAYLGYLSLPGVIALAAFAGFVGDETWFFAGRRYGKAILGRFPRLAKTRPYVKQKLERYGTWVVLFSRFAIGLRIAGPIIIGASGMPPARFMPPNAVGAIVWAVLVASAGFVFGTAFMALLEHAKRYEKAAFVAIAAAALVVVTLRGWWIWRLEARASAREPADADALK
jgi:membrane protein DedA with SNARE-associated domain